MKTLQHYQDKIQKTLEEINLSGTPETLYEPIIYTMASGGKRLRPVLTLMACDIFDGNINNALYPAIAVEIFHNFTLIHDDIMDDASIRRGKPTVYKKWNANVGILSGDAMMIKAYEILNKAKPADFTEIFPIFNDMALKVCEGQQYDMDYETRQIISLSEYIQMIKLKTATLIGGALEIGAAIAHANTENRHHLTEFGKNIGLAFQLQDDFLDAYADELVFGKQIGKDIICGKKTFMLIKALETADNDTKNNILNTIENKAIKDAEKINTILEIYNRLDLRKAAQSQINTYYKNGIYFLDRINVPEHKKLLLKSFIQNLMVRNK